MGRQTTVALSEEDERAFLAFLRADADVRIFRHAASSRQLLTVSSFPPRGPRELSFLLWNTAFPWVPEYGQWPVDMEGPELASKFHVANTAGAPLIEYSRHALSNPNPTVHGRVYWNTDFAIYQGAAYDTRALSRWYDHVVRWLRTNRVRVEITKNWFQYWLPDAWAQR